MTGRHGTPACGDRDRCLACHLEHADGKPRRWFDVSMLVDTADTPPAPPTLALPPLDQLDLDGLDLDGAAP